MFSRQNISDWPQIGQLDRNIKHTVLNYVKLILWTKCSAKLRKCQAIKLFMKRHVVLYFMYKLVSVLQM